MEVKAKAFTSNFFTNHYHCKFYHLEGKKKIRVKIVTVYILHAGARDSTSIISPLLTCSEQSVKSVTVPNTEKYWNKSARLPTTVFRKAELAWDGQCTLWEYIWQVTKTKRQASITKRCNIKQLWLGSKCTIAYKYSNRDGRFSSTTHFHLFGGLLLLLTKKIN